MAKTKKRTFSVVKAVKANARRRLGTPPGSAVIHDAKHKLAHGPVKHRRPLEALLGEARREESTVDSA